MPISIEINDAHVDPLIEFYIHRIKVLRDEITIRERELKDISAQVLKLKNGKSLSTRMDPVLYAPTMTQYSEKWTWLKKIRFTIELKGCALTTNEIVDILAEREIGLMFERKKAIASVSSVLSTKSGPGKTFLKIESDSGEYAYSFNESKASDPKVDVSNPFD